MRFCNGYLIDICSKSPKPLSQYHVEDLDMPEQKSLDEDAISEYEYQLAMDSM